MLLEYCPVVCRDERNRLFASAWIRLADNGCLFHPGELINDLLYFTRINVNSIYQQHILFSVGDKIVAVRIPVANVPGQKPAITQYPGSFLGLVPVADHHVAAAYTKLSDLIVGQLT